MNYTLALENTLSEGADDAGVTHAQSLTLRLSTKGCIDSSIFVLVSVCTYLLPLALAVTPLTQG